MNLENPFQFDLFKSDGNVELSYSNIFEIIQGGPEVGYLFVNRTKVKGIFGGPALIYKEIVIAPVYVNFIFYSGFRLALIDVKTLKIKVIGRIANLIFLDKVINGELFYFEDIEKNRLFSIKLK